MDRNLVSKSQTTGLELEYPKGCVAISAPQLEPPRRGLEKKVCCSALTGALATSRRWYQSSIRHLSSS